jgi:radical SAM superfamily enzyme YgiQ (UPF0313 family)
MSIKAISTKSTEIKEIENRLKTSFKHITDSYDFTKTALLVQIPQVDPEFVEHKIAIKRGYFAYLPQSLFYLAAQLRELGVKSKILDLNYEVLNAATEEKDPNLSWKNSLRKSLNDESIGFACISFMFEPTRNQLEDIISFIKSNWPSVAILVGGVAASSDPELIFTRTDANIVFLNEGEGPLKAFYEAINTNHLSLYNVVLKDFEGNPVWADIKFGGEINLDIRNEFSKIPFERYCKVGSLNNFSRLCGLDTPYATVISRRGCRARCTFCSVRNFNGMHVRTRPSVSVVDEMVFLNDKFGVKHFEWLDDDLIYDEEEAINLFNEISRRLPGITWAANNGVIARFITPNIMQAMEDSGCVGFGVGLESGNPETLKKIKKPITIKKFNEFCEIAKAYPRIFKIVFLILGLPDERFIQMLDSYAVARKSDLDWTSYFLYQPLKNTESYVSYAIMDDETDESIKLRGTTMNFNPNRSSLKSSDIEDKIYNGYDIFDLDGDTIPSKEQLREIWFTFNYVTNFLRHPALFSESDVCVRNAISWFRALSEAYAENPIIDCLIYYLEKKLNEKSSVELESIRTLAVGKIRNSKHYQKRDKQFSFSSFLDGKIPSIDKRAEVTFNHGAIQVISS